MTGAPERSKHLKVVSINDRALDNIRYIRETMERAGSFTAVPGWGGVAMGVTALVTAIVASQLPSIELWFTAWLAEAMLASAIGGLTMLRKARAMKNIINGPGRRFALSLCPAMLAGAILTIVLFDQGLFHLMPGVWLLFYGVAIVNGGAHSVKIVPIMGVCFMAIGVAALVLPFAWANGIMALGFGGLHVACGAVIARRYGG